METKRRGLGSLIPGIEGHWAEATEGVREVRVDEITANPYQPRGQFDVEKLEELASSLREHGVIQPLVVRANGAGFELIAGERRLQAARMAGLELVPVVVRECTEQEMLELAVIENVQREDINCVEAGRAYRRLVDEFGLTQEAVAERIGKSRSAVANTMRLLTLPSPVLESLLAGRISEGHGRALLGLGEENEMVAACRRVEVEGLSVREAEALVAHRTEKGEERKVSRETSAPAAALDANLRSLQDRMRLALGTKVAIKPRGERGAIEIEYYCDEDLDRISSYILGENEDIDA